MQGFTIGFVEDPPGCVMNSSIAKEGDRYIDENRNMPGKVLAYGTDLFVKAAEDWSSMYFGCKFVPEDKWDSLTDFSTVSSPMTPRLNSPRNSPRSSESSPRTPLTPRASRRLSRKTNSPRSGKATISHFDKWEPMLRKCDYVVIFHRGNSSGYWLPHLPLYENLLYTVCKVLK